MLEVFINFICALLIELTGLYIIKEFTKFEINFNILKLFILIINAILVVMVHYMEFNTFTSLLNITMNVITYRIIFNKKFSESLIYTSILMIVVLISEVFWLAVFVNVFTINNLKENIFLYLITNIVIVSTSLLFVKIKIISKQLTRFYKVLAKKEQISSLIFVVIFSLSISSLMYNMIMHFHRSMFFYSNLIITTTIIIIAIIYVYVNDQYNKLSNSYDVLLSNVSNFEYWIENEQFVRHEYKNQLAYLYESTSDKKVKQKIQEIIDQNLNIDNSTVYALRGLPKDGLKGLMYYKAIVAQNNKIDLTINVSIKEKGILSKLTKEKLKTLSKILGILFDNAIEASKLTRKKIILLEIYELKDRVNIVISNTFKAGTLVENRFEKGISSKGEGRGKGLYFAKKILNNNDWITEKQEIIDDYYIETITIKKSTLK